MDEIEFYQSALNSIKQQISREKEGLILDSGTIKPDIINWTEIAELEEDKKKYEKKLAELLKTADA
jgi:hypothetical protein